MLTEKEIKEALYRSGYLLESRVSNWFTNNDFSVEPNFTFFDPTSQKSREIDLSVETNAKLCETKEKVQVNTDFIIETINNDRPVVFFSNRKYVDTDTVFSSINYLSKFPGTQNDYMFLIDHLKLHYFNNLLATQYCSFQEKKKNKREDVEWMAYHPEDLYDTFRKLLFSSKSVRNKWVEIFDDNNWHRLFRFQPLVIITSDLLEAEVEGKNVNLIKKKMIPFVFNYSFETEHYSIIIDIITEDYLDSYILKMKNEDELIFNNILELLKKNKKC